MSSGSRHVAIVTFGNLASPAVALLTAPILARALEATGRGELAAATAPLMLGMAALTVGLPEALTHFTAKFGRLSRGSLGFALAFSGLLGLAGVAFIALLANTLASGDQGLAELLILCSCAIIPALLAGCFRGVARGQQRWVLVASEQIVNALLKLGVLGGLFLSGSLTVTAASVTLALSSFLGCIVYFRLWRLPSDVPAVSVGPGRMTKFGLSVWLGAVAGVALSRLDQTLILPLSSAAILGVYAVSVSLADAARVFNLAVRDVIFTRQSAAVDDVALATAARISTLVTILISLFVVPAAFLIVVPLFGRDFSGVPFVVAVLLIGTVLGNPGSVVAAGLSARGKPIFRSLALLVGVLLNIVLIFTLVPYAGAVGAALATSIANVVTGVLVLIFGRLFFGIRIPDVVVIRASDILLFAQILRGFMRR